uniref:Helicase-associated domain-containing protein n=1 Tax=Ditylum brightwellii TaxID=49249 RepID=A0A6U3UDC3_9STRA
MMEQNVPTIVTEICVKNEGNTEDGDSMDFIQENHHNQAKERNKEDKITNMQPDSSEPISSLQSSSLPSSPSKIAFKPRLSEERRAKLDAIGFVWSLKKKRVDEHWDTMLQQLLDYKKEHGDCLVPSRYEKNLKLGKWVETQRYEYTKLQRAEQQKQKEEGGGGESSTSATTKSRPLSIRLTEERLKRLESIGFEWKVKHKMKRHYDKQWNEMFEKLLDYKRKNGHCLVPKRCMDDIKLGTWVHTQRIQYRKTMMDTKEKKEEGETTAAAMSDDKNNTIGEEDVYLRLNDERRTRLESIGFVWSVRENAKLVGKNNEMSPHTAPAVTLPPPSLPAPMVTLTRNTYDDQWDAMFDRLKSFKERYGNCLVPKRCPEDQKLGTWVDTQRVQYKKLVRKLAGIADAKTPKKIDESIVKVEDVENHSILEQDRSKALSASGKPLVGRLTDERIERLSDLGFVWEVRGDWQKHYEELVVYKKEHGDCNVPARYPKNRRLGIWVSAQRQQYKLMCETDGPKPQRSAPLSQKRIDILNDLGFVWALRSRDSLGDTWSQRLAELKTYKATHGDCLVPSRYPPNPELGVWVGTQRTQYRLYMTAKEEGLKVNSSSAMNDARIKQLEDMGFAWALRGTSDNVWAKRMEELQLYVLKYGSCNVPRVCGKFPRLANWVSFCRTQYRLYQEGKPSSMNEAKISDLNSMGFLWDIPEGNKFNVNDTKLTNVETHYVKESIPMNAFCEEANAGTEMTASLPQNVTTFAAHKQAQSTEVIYSPPIGPIETYIQENVIPVAPLAKMGVLNTSSATDRSIAFQSHRSMATPGPVDATTHLSAAPPSAEEVAKIAQVVDATTVIMPHVGLETAAAIAAPGPVAVAPELARQNIQNMGIIADAVSNCISETFASRSVAKTSERAQQESLPTIPDCEKNVPKGIGEESRFSGVTPDTTQNNDQKLERVVAHDIATTMSAHNTNAVPYAHAGLQGITILDTNNDVHTNPTVKDIRAMILAIGTETTEIAGPIDTAQGGAQQDIDDIREIATSITDVAMATPTGGSGATTNTVALHAEAVRVPKVTNNAQTLVCAVSDTLDTFHSHIQNIGNSATAPTALAVTAGVDLGTPRPNPVANDRISDQSQIYGAILATSHVGTDCDPTSEVDLSAYPMVSTSRETRHSGVVNVTNIATDKMNTIIAPPTGYCGTDKSTCTNLTTENSAESIVAGYDSTHFSVSSVTHLVPTLKTATSISLQTGNTGMEMPENECNNVSGVSVDNIGVRENQVDMPNPASSTTNATTFVGYDVLNISEAAAATMVVPNVLPDSSVHTRDN